MSAAKKTIYAAIGAGTTVIGKARELPKVLRSDARLVPFTIKTVNLRELPTKVQELPAKVQELPTKVQELPGRVQAFGFSIPARATDAVGFSRDVAERATKRATDLLGDLTDRGESLYKRIQRSQPTKKAVTQTKTAKSRVKAASSSVKKAVEADVDAVKAAAEKAVDASA